MNEPIISPWLFYALFVVDNVKSAFVASMLICGVVLLFSPMIDDKKVFTKCIKAFCAVFIISGVLMVFIPDSKTITQMIIAKHITISNIEKTGQLTERVVDKIIEKVVKVSEELNKR